MFELRSIFVSLGFFGVLYCLLSLLLAASWRTVKLFQSGSAARLAPRLFWLRISPLLGSALITLLFALPAFLKLEGPADEDLGTFAFGFCAILLFSAALFRVITTRSRTRRLVADWMDTAHALDAGAPVPTFQAKAGIPPLLLYGVSSPAVLVSETTVALLSDAELRVAVQHEVEHMRSRDNLKKLVIHCCPFPGMGGLDRAWQEAAELAADETAISNRGEAIDLAAALIKLSHLVPVQLPPAFTTGLVNAATSISLRVERLLSWEETQQQDVQLRAWYLLPFVLAVLSYLVIGYSHELLLTHRLTEWFVH